MNARVQIFVNARVQIAQKITEHYRSISFNIP